MKQKLFLLVKNTFLTTGLSLCLLSLVAYCMGGCAIFIPTVWQNLFANACIHSTLAILRKWESPYYLLDAAVDITVMSLIVLGVAWLFGWFSSTPHYVLIPMVILLYAAGSVFQVFRVRKELDYINQKLNQRNTTKIT